MLKKNKYVVPLAGIQYFCDANPPPGWRTEGYIIIAIRLVLKVMGRLSFHNNKQENIHVVSRLQHLIQGINDCYGRNVQLWEIPTSKYL